MARLPIPGSDSGNWGSILNDFLGQSHNNDGSLKTNVVTAGSIQDGTISEAKLDAAAQAKLNSGGTAGVTTVNTRSGAVTLTAADVGLANVDNTSDANKPVSSATQAALNSKADSSALTSGLAGKANSGHTHTSADITNLTEATKDTLASTLVAGTNVTLNYNDGAGTLTVSATPGAGVTDLTAAYAADSVTVISSTGNDALIDDATSSTAGVLSAADKTKLDGISAGATANATNAQLRDRTTHTGVQAISTIANLQATLDSKSDSGIVTTHEAATDPHATASYAILVGGGRRIFVQATDPGGAANDGDLWVDTV